MSAGGYYPDEIYLMGEPYAFYTATNTFRNPIFDSLTGQEAAPAHPSEQVVARPGSGSGSGSGPAEAVAAAEHSKQNKNANQDRGGAQDERARRRRAAKSHPATSSKLPLIGQARRRCVELCDNWALTARDKLFVMETNLKRRVRILRTFLDRNLPHWMQPAASRARAHERAKRARFGEAARQERHVRAGRADQRLFNPSEPVSAKALGVQQERILGRLERIRSDKQRLPSSASSSMEGLEEGGGGGWRKQPARRLPKSASSPAAQLTIPFWLVRSVKDERRAGASSDADCRPSSSGVRAPKTARTTSRSSPLSKCARATSSLLANAQGHTRRKEAEQKKTCIVCYERTPNIVTLPCEHSDVCSDCFIEIIYVAVKNSQYPLRCVLCRAKVERIRCSRRLMLSVIKRNRTSSTKSALFSF